MIFECCYCCVDQPVCRSSQTLEAGEGSLPAQLPAGGAGHCSGEREAMQLSPISYHSTLKHASPGKTGTFEGGKDSFSHFE